MKNAVKLPSPIMWLGNLCTHLDTREFNVATLNLTNATIDSLRVQSEHDLVILFNPYTDADLYWIIQNEGFKYALEHFIVPGWIESDETQTLLEQVLALKDKSEGVALAREFYKRVEKASREVE